MVARQCALCSPSGCPWRNACWVSRKLKIPLVLHFTASPPSPDAVIKHIPSPTALSEERIESLLSGAHGDFQNLPEAVRGLKGIFLSCRSCADPAEDEGGGAKGDPDVPTIAFVAKMFVPSEMPDGLCASKAKGYMATVG